LAHGGFDKEDKESVRRVKRMKRFTVLLLTLAILFSFAACRGKTTTAPTTESKHLKQRAKNLQ